MRSVSGPRESQVRFLQVLLIFEYFFFTVNPHYPHLQCYAHFRHIYYRKMRKWSTNHNLKVLMYSNNCKPSFQNVLDSITCSNCHVHKVQLYHISCIREPSLMLMKHLDILSFCSLENTSRASCNNFWWLTLLFILVWIHCARIRFSGEGCLSFGLASDMLVIVMWGV